MVQIDYAEKGWAEAVSLSSDQQLVERPHKINRAKLEVRKLYLLQKMTSAKESK